jgi:hypothetical protein
MVSAGVAHVAKIRDKSFGSRVSSTSSSALGISHTNVVNHRSCKSGSSRDVGSMVG